MSLQLNHLNPFKFNTMKQIFLFLLVSTLSISSFAQKKMKEGVIVLELTEIESDDPQMSAMLGSMKGGTLETVFSPDMQKTTNSMMGGMINTTVFIDIKNKKTKTFMDMMGNKVAIKATGDETESDLDSDIDIKKTGETKTIKGYTAHKYIITPKSKDMEGGEFVVYVAEDIQLGAINLSQGLNTSKIKGAPLEMSMNVQGMKMVFTAKTVSDTLPKDAFKEPKGYKEMTMEEFQKSMGGFGF